LERNKDKIIVMNEHCSATTDYAFDIKNVDAIRDGEIKNLKIFS
jgi:hypothetical protein